MCSNCEAHLLTNSEDVSKGDAFQIILLLSFLSYNSDANSFKYIYKRTGLTFDKCCSFFATRFYENGGAHIISSKKCFRRIFGTSASIKFSCHLHFQ